MGKDIYLEKVTNAKIEDGVVSVGCGVADGSAGEETVRLRIPLPKFQAFAARFRDILVKAMEDGWYGDNGRKAAEEAKGAGR